MSRPPIWVKSHPRRLPERPAAFIAVHTELLEAKRLDLTLATLREQIAAEVERDMQESR
jgi:hypothetical protein